MDDADPKPILTFRRVLVLLVAAPTLFVLLLTIASFFARHWWRAEQFCHFRLQYGWLLALAAVALLLTREKRFAALAAIGAAVNFGFVLPIYFPSAQPRSNGATTKIVSYNLLSSNDRYDDVGDFLRQEQADVVLLYEVSLEWDLQLKKLDDLYPHQHLIPQRNNFGIAVLSKVSWEQIGIVDYGTQNAPSLIIRFQDLPGPRTIIATHPLPPASPQATEMRNLQLEKIATDSRRARKPVVVCGDLNITSYSPFFRDLLRNGHLRDSRQGLGVQASWSPRIPLLFTIPIDHCLVSAEIEVASRRVGPKLGSDHRPVIVELR